MTAAAGSTSEILLTLAVIQSFLPEGMLGINVTFMEQN
jgi:hypothetical protein